MRRSRVIDKALGILISQAAAASTHGLCVPHGAGRALNLCALSANSSWTLAASRGTNVWLRP